MIHIIDVHIITYFAVSGGNSVSTEIQRLSVVADSLPPPPFLVTMSQNIISNISAISIMSSHFIFNARDHQEWESPGYVGPPIRKRGRTPGCN